TRSRVGNEAGLGSGRHFNTSTQWTCRKPTCLALPSARIRPLLRRYAISSTAPTSRHCRKKPSRPRNEGHLKPGDDATAKRLSVTGYDVLCKLNQRGFYR